jgi:hypothetical protein
MATSLTHDPVRELPIYQSGLAAGVSIGLMIALNVIVAELTRQEDAAIVAALDDPHGQSAASHEHAAGRLLSVARIVSATFRTRP